MFFPSLLLLAGLFDRLASSPLSRSANMLTKRDGEAAPPPVILDNDTKPSRWEEEENSVERRVKSNRELVKDNLREDYYDLEDNEDYYLPIINIRFKRDTDNNNKEEIDNSTSSRRAGGERDKKIQANSLEERLPSKEDNRNSLKKSNRSLRKSHRRRNRNQRRRKLRRNHA